MKSDGLLLINNSPLFASFWSWLRIFLSIDETVEKLEWELPTPGETSPQVVEQEYKKLVQDYASLKDSIKKKSRGVAGGLGAAIRNVKNIALNAFDNTVGYGIAKYQNSKSTRTLRKDSAAQIVYLANGLLQNEGSQWRLARQLRKKGKVPYHLKMSHGLEREEHAEKIYEQVTSLHEKTNIRDAHERNDAYTGHSSGADMGIYLAGDPRTPQYGIKKVQARAPAPTGIEAKTFGQKLLMPLAKDDNVKRYEGRRSVVELSEREPVIPVQVLAGEADRLVLPEDTVYKHAADHDYIKGPDSTHFGTSGVNKEINEQIIYHLDKPPSQYKPLKSAPADESSSTNVVSLNDYKAAEPHAAEPPSQAPLRPAPSEGPTATNVLSLNDYKTKDSSAQYQSEKAA